MAKTGVDDYLAAGGTIAALRLMARPFDPEDLEAERLARDKRLRTALAELRCILRDMPLRTMRQNTAASVLRVLTEEAAKSGELVEDGIRAVMDRRTLAERVQSSLRGVHNAIEYLENEGRLKRDNDGRRAEKAGAFILIPQGSAKGIQYGGGDSRGKGQQAEEKEEKPLSIGGFPRGDYLLRYPPPAVPEVRWSKLILYWARENGRRKVVDWHHVARLGKKRAAIIQHVFESGGRADVREDLMPRFAGKRARPWDFERRTLGPLVAAGILALEGGAVSLTADWFDALEKRREEDDEIRDAERQRKRYAEQRRKYRRRHEHPADSQPSPLRGKVAVARMVEERREEDKERWIEEERQKVGMTAATFLADELDGVSAVRFYDVRQRFAQRGGPVAELRRAVLYGPWKFKRESDGDLYIYREDADGRAYVGPTERIWRERQRSSADQEERKLPPKVDGIYQHSPLCDCDWCSDPPEPRYVRLGGMA